MTDKLRQQFWDDSKSLVKWCTDNELKVLISIATKDLNKRHEKYIDKFDRDLAKKKAAKSKSMKKHYKRTRL